MSKVHTQLEEGKDVIVCMLCLGGKEFGKNHFDQNSPLFLELLMKVSFIKNK